jgi:hypothetical protein
MEFFTNNQTLIIIIVITLVIIAIGSFISKMRKKKQEEEINNMYNYSSTSRPKVPKSPTPEHKIDNNIKYRFDLNTGEEINKTEKDDLFSTPATMSEEEVIRIFEKNIANINLSEKQKQKALEIFKNNLLEKPTNNTVNLEEKIKVIENSNLSEKRKRKLIEFLKEKNKNLMLGF